MEMGLSRVLVATQLIVMRSMRLGMQGNGESSDAEEGFELGQKEVARRCVGVAKTCLSRLPSVTSGFGSGTLRKRGACPNGVDVDESKGRF